MSGLRHAIILGIGFFALTRAGAARAQDLSAGKTPAELFHYNCALCHNSPRGLAAAGAQKGGMSGLEGFLAEHYTSDTKSAEIIAAYLKSAGGAAPAEPAKHHRDAAKRHKPGSKSDSAKKSDNNKKSDAKPDQKSEAKPAVTKPAAAAKKKPASSPTEAKDGKPVAGDKKAD